MNCLKNFLLNNSSFHSSSPPARLFLWGFSAFNARSPPPSWNLYNILDFELSSPDLTVFWVEFSVLQTPTSAIFSIVSATMSQIKEFIEFSEAMTG